MKDHLDAKFSEQPIGIAVRAPVPNVDRGQTDVRSVLARIISKRTDRFYKIKN